MTNVYLGMPTVNILKYWIAWTKSLIPAQERMQKAEILLIFKFIKIFHDQHLLLTYFLYALF